MRTLRLLVMAFAMVSVSSVALAQEFMEDFESYAAGTDLQNVGGWKGWNGAAGASAPVSDAFAFSGSNSVEIVPAADLVHEFDISGGKWVFSAMQYIPSGGTGTTWFILLNTYADNGGQDWSVQTQFVENTGAITSSYTSDTATIVYDQWIQLLFIIDLDENTVEEYYNGELFTTHQWDDGDSGTIQVVDLYGNNASSVYYDDVSLESYIEYTARATVPRPAEQAIDVPRDGVLSWSAGSLAATHDVYFGTVYGDVSAADRANPMGVLASRGQTGTTFDPDGLLDFSQTYYWRVDEVSAAPDNTIYKGDVWSFTAEPLVYPIQNIVATSNTTPDEGAVPDNAVNGSGLNENDEHSRDADAMWLGAPTGDDPVYIQFEFDRVYKLEEMQVWNYNGEFEMLLAFGIKDVTVEYSSDGIDWTVQGDVTLAQGTARSDYLANTTIDFAGIGAKFVRLTVNSGYGMFGKYGLSEVRFLYTPAHARDPQPADGATDANPNGVLSWRVGREAVTHEVYLSADEAAVADGTALVDTVADNSLSLRGLDLQYDTAYFWKVNEVNEAEAISTWEGNVWTFTTQEYGVVEDFESYTDDPDAGEAIYQTWIDGWENDTGSTVGHFEAPFAEQDIVHSGSQSMPLFYENTGGLTTSETDRTFDTSQNWAGNGIQSLSLYFYGDPDNTGQLYLKINSTKVLYDGDATDISRVEWQPWIIDLSEVGGNLQNVTSLTIGVEGAGATGVLYIDDIGLYPRAPEFLTPVEPDSANLAGHWTFDEATGAVATDISGNNNNGTIVDATRQAGKSGSALKFNGTSAYVSIPAAAWSTIEQQATVSVWMYVDSSVTQSPFTFAAFQNPAVGNSRVMSAHVVWGDGTLYFDTGGDASGYDRISKAAGANDYADAWIHWAFTKNADTGDQKIYRNGMLWHSGTGLTRSMTGVTVFTLGSQVNQTAFWNGMMDDFRLYNRELTQEEILWLAGRTEPRHKPF